MSGRRLRDGDLVSRGNTSDVWLWSPTSVVKILRPEIPNRWAQLEAAITNSVHAAGLPVPRVEGTVTIEGRTGVVFERIDGPSMWEVMKAAPGEVPDLVGALVGLQSDVQGAGSIEGVPDLVGRLHEKISDVAALPRHENRRAAAVLDDLPKGSVLCHGDMHPHNILMSSRGMVIVDWFDAAVGNATADFVRSSLLMRPSSVDAAQTSHLHGASRELRLGVHRAYLTELAKVPSFDSARFAEWEAVLAFARMSEPVPTSELTAIWRRWCDRSGDAEPVRGMSPRSSATGSPASASGHQIA